MRYEFYDWDKEDKDWIWIGGDSGYTRITDKNPFYLGINAFRNQGQFDKEHFIDDCKIIEMIKIKYCGKEFYISKYEACILESIHKSYTFENTKIPQTIKIYDPNLEKHLLDSLKYLKYDRKNSY